MKCSRLSYPTQSYLFTYFCCFITPQLTGYWIYNIMKQMFFCRTPLHMACFRGSSLFIKELLAKSPNSFKHCDRLGRTPIHYAAWGDNENKSAAFLLAKSGELILKRKWKKLYELLLLGFRCFHGQKLSKFIRLYKRL